MNSVASTLVDWNFMMKDKLTVIAQRIRTRSSSGSMRRPILVHFEIELPLAGCKHNQINTCFVVYSGSMFFILYSELCNSLYRTERLPIFLCFDYNLAIARAKYFVKIWYLLIWNCSHWKSFWQIEINSSTCRWKHKTYRKINIEHMPSFLCNSFIKR